MSDAAEGSFGYDPNDADQDGSGLLDGQDDWDLDGVTNAAELAAGTWPGNPPGAPVPAGGGGSDGGGGCGATGMEVLIVLGFLAGARGRR